MNVRDLKGSIDFLKRSKNEGGEGGSTVHLLDQLDTS